MRSRRWRWVVALLVCVAAVAVTMLVDYYRHTVPLSQCSEVYRRYRDFPGVRAAFIKDKQINDTLSLDMTLLLADDSASFVALLKSLGRSDGYITDMFKADIQDDNCRLTGLYPREGREELDDVLTVFPSRQLVALFHATEGEQLDILLTNNLKGIIKIENDETNN